MRPARPCILPSQPATRSVLLATGVTGRMIRTQLAAGRLVRIRQNVFISVDSWPAEEEARFVVRARAEQTVHSHAVISHGAAAAILGLPTPGAADGATDRWS